MEWNRADEELRIKVRIFTSAISIYELGGRGCDFNVVSFRLYRFLLLSFFALLCRLFAFRFSSFVTSSFFIILSFIFERLLALFLLLLIVKMHPAICLMYFWRFSDGYDDFDVHLR